MLGAEPVHERIERYCREYGASIRSVLTVTTEVIVRVLVDETNRGFQQLYYRLKQLDARIDRLEDRIARVERHFIRH